MEVNRQTAVGQPVALTILTCTYMRGARQQTIQRDIKDRPWPKTREPEKLVIREELQYLSRAVLQFSLLRPYTNKGPKQQQ